MRTIRLYSIGEKALKTRWGQNTLNKSWFSVFQPEMFLWNDIDLDRIYKIYENFFSYIAPILFILSKKLTNENLILISAFSSSNGYRWKNSYRQYSQAFIKKNITSPLFPMLNRQSMIRLYRRYTVCVHFILVYWKEVKRHSPFFGS